jgi:hypothetical protein
MINVSFGLESYNFQNPKHSYMCTYVKKIVWKFYIYIFYETHKIIFFFMCYEKIEYSLKTCPHSIMHSTQH